MKEGTVYQLDTRDKPRLLFAMMHAFASEKSRLSLEGNLSHTELAQMEGRTQDEDDVLKRGTLQPKLDFLVFPLTSDNVAAIEKAVQSKIRFNGNSGIIHAQIEVDKQIVFAAYDNFGKDSTIAKEEVPVELLEELVKARILRGYSRIEAK